MKCGRRIAVSVLLAASVALSGLASQASAAPGAYEVLTVNTFGSAPTMLQAAIAAQPGVVRVENFDADSATPSAALLSGYDLVVSMSYVAVDDPTTYGNRLADYVDAGGVVFQYAYDNTPAYDPEGRWISGGYAPYTTGPPDNTDTSLGAYDASSPLMQGVATLAAGSLSDPALAPGATRVAKWLDGREAIAYKDRVVSSSANLDDSDWSGDFGRLTVNAVRWLGRHTLSVSKAGTGSGAVTSSPAGIDCGTTCAANFPYPEQVTLTATASSGSAFTGWSDTGCSGTGPCVVTVDAAKSVAATFTDVAPSVSGFGLDPRAIRAAAKGGSIARAPVGTSVSYALSEAATAAFTVQRAKAGRKKGRRCVAPNRRNQQSPRCTRYRRVKGSFSHAGEAGLNRFRFTGRLRGKKLPPGRYRLVVVVADAAGQKSTPARAKFRVVRRSVHQAENDRVAR